MEQNPSWDAKSSSARHSTYFTEPGGLSSHSKNTANSPYHEPDNCGLSPLNKLLLEYTVLGVVAKLRKVTISFVMSVCLSVCPSVRLGSYWKDFHEILAFSENLSKKFQDLFNSNKNIGYNPLAPEFSFKF